MEELSIRQRTLGITTFARYRPLLCSFCLFFVHSDVAATRGELMHRRTLEQPLPTTIAVERLPQLRRKASLSRGTIVQAGTPIAQRRQFAVTFREADNEHR